MTMKGLTDSLELRVIQAFKFPYIEKALIF